MGLGAARPARRNDSRAATTASATMDMLARVIGIALAGGLVPGAAAHAADPVRSGVLKPDTVNREIDSLAARFPGLITM